MLRNPELSIVIVSFNTKKFTKSCLDSISEKIRSVKYEVILVDNASTDSSVEYLSKFCARKKNFVLVKNGENIGFAAANNIGIKKSKGKYVLFLNSDTEIKEDFFSDIIDWMNQNKKVGVASCSLLNTDGTVQATGGYFPTLIRVISWMTIQDLPLVDRFIKPFHPVGNDFYNENKKIDWVTGAFFLVKKQTLKDVGIFDEDYFMYTEEVDFCYRASKKGWEVWYLPSWSVVHHGGKSGTKEFAVLSEFKGVKTFFRKHYPKWQYLILRFFLKLGSLGRIIVMGLKEGPNSAKIYAKAFFIA